LVLECKTTLEKLAQKNDIRLVWVPGHAAIGQRTHQWPLSQKYEIPAGTKQRELKDGDRPLPAEAASVLDEYNRGSYLSRMLGRGRVGRTHLVCCLAFIRSQTTFLGQSIMTPRAIKELRPSRVVDFIKSTGLL